MSTRLREGVILMLSLLATHAENSKTSKILDNDDSARTPSELVQKLLQNIFLVDSKDSGECRDHCEHVDETTV